MNEDKMCELFKNYLKNHLSICLEDERFGNNGICKVVKIKIDNEVISEDCFTIKEDGAM